MSTDNTFAPDKRKLRQSLERATSTHDSAAFLHREIADRMFDRLDYIKLNPKLILDVGCRTGYGTRKLTTHFGEATIIATDIARGMLHQANNQGPWWKRQLPFLGNPSPKYLCADPEQLPLAPNKANLIWSNLALHWFDLERSAAEAHRVLATEGLFMFSTLGPDTLKELRSAFTGVDGYQHVNRFIDMHDIGDALVHAGFADPVMDMEVITVTFDDVATMVRDLKSLGARNHLQSRRPGLMAPGRWKEVVGRYESFRKEGKLPVTIEVIYGHAWKPQPKTLGDGRQIIQFRDYARRGSDV